MWKWLAVVMVSSAQLCWADDEEESLGAAQLEFNRALSRYADLRAKAARGDVVGTAKVGVVVKEEGDGLYVEAVTPGSPAEEAALRSGDVLVSVSGEALTGRGAHRKLVGLVHAAAKVGGSLAFEVLRGGIKTTVSVRAPVAKVDQFTDLRKMFSMFAEQNLSLASLNDELGAYFGTTEGVLVLKVAKDDWTKLRGGDVVLKIGDRTATGPMQAMRILRSYEPGDHVTLEVRRQQKVVTLESMVPAKER